MELTVEQLKSVNHLVLVLALSLNLFAATSTVGAEDAMRLLQYSYYDRENHTVEEMQAYFGCREVVPQGFFARKRDMSACVGTWQGHINESTICAPNWHVCSSKDKQVFDDLTYQDLMKIRGCFAMNAAHNKHTACSDCIEGQQLVMSGAGRDCPMYDDMDHGKCIKAARSDLRRSTHEGPSCTAHHMMSGVVCCRDTPLEDPPKLLNYGYHKHLVKMGERVRLQCRARGQTRPTIVWRKNGLTVDNTTVAGVSVHSQYADNVTVSVLTIQAATMNDDAQYSCLASNRFGSDIGVQHRLNVWNLRSRKRGCRAGAEQIVLPGGEVFACAGKWRGHVKDAGKKLCGRKYTVCDPWSDGIRFFDRIDVRKTRIIPGCYAYDGASNKRSYCERCNGDRQDNQMAGLGSDCGAYDTNTPSCMGLGRIEVWPDQSMQHSRNLTGGHYSDATAASSKRAQQSCRYQEELTTGVLCCKARKSSSQTRSRRSSRRHKH